MNNNNITLLLEKINDNLKPTPKKKTTPFRLFVKLLKDILSFSKRIITNIFYKILNSVIFITSYFINQFLMCFAPFCCVYLIFSLVLIIVILIIGSSFSLDSFESFELIYYLGTSNRDTVLDILGYEKEIVEVIQIEGNPINQDWTGL